MSRVTVGISGMAAVLLFIALGGCVRSQACNGAVPAFQSRVQGAEVLADQLLHERGGNELQCWAAQGDAMAQFALGTAYERGIGVAASRERALHYYRQAGATVSSDRAVYSPPLPHDKYGRVNIYRGQDRPGLAEAKLAYQRLKQSR